MAAVSWLVVGLLVLLTMRRFGLLIAALSSPRPIEVSSAPPVLVVVAARDEARQVKPLLDALDALEYQEDSLSFVLVNDGSGDDTGALFDRWCRERTRATYIQLESSIGKAAAIQAALDAAPVADLLAVYDADVRPRPDSLRTLVRAFGDEKVGAVSGFRAPLDADRSLVSRYAALEAWVYQLVVQAGKDRFGWNPVTMGANCVYRFRALEDQGGFRTGAFSEDVEISLSMIARGWRTRFLTTAVADYPVAVSLSHYANQRIRWSYGMYRSFRLARGLESLAVVSGYADRLVFAAACVLATLGGLSPAWLLMYLSAPGLEVIVALAKVGRLRTAPLFVLGAIPMFLFDIASTLHATLRNLLGRKPDWRPFL